MATIDIHSDLVLGIESSCDETAAAVVADGFRVLSSVVASQAAKHAVYGGVVPELAAREHLKNIEPVVSAALDNAGVALEDISGIRVTNGPGLMPALQVGVNFAKGMALANRLPLVGVNHFLAHVKAAFLAPADADSAPPKPAFPLLALVVSGGHTSLALFDAEGRCEIIGTTIDDAAGEALDKAAKLLGLGYPGGPVIERVAREGNPAAFAFPRSLTGGTGRPLDPANRFNFSFSGLKTALLRHVEKNSGENREIEGAFLADTVASYQEAVVDVLTMKAMDAAAEFAAKTVVLCGGVACNAPLRERVARACDSAGTAFLVPEKRYCADNAAMVAAAGTAAFDCAEDADFSDLDVYARIPHGEPLRCPL
jgi:N6-L-threonylcarbamoyladenine synthase